MLVSAVTTIANDTSLVDHQQYTLISTTYGTYMSGSDYEDAHTLLEPLKQ